MKSAVNSGIMGRTEKVFSHPSALSNDLDWRSSVPSEDSNTRLIPLTRGKIAIVDADDYERLLPYKWYAYPSRNTFYAQASIKQKTIQMHRFILGITDPKLLTDHKDGDGLNNSKSNIRPCTNAQNQCNARRRSGAQNKFKGVRYSAGKWDAQITVNGKGIFLGRFASENEAALAYNRAAVMYFNEFAKLNTVPSE